MSVTKVGPEEGDGKAARAMLAGGVVGTFGAAVDTAARAVAVEAGVGAAVAAAATAGLMAVYSPSCAPPACHAQ